MPTYNGTQIITEILYEDGTIEVKVGFPLILETPASIDLSSVDQSKVKNKLAGYELEVEKTKPVVGLTSTDSSKQKIKIKENALFDIDRGSLDLTTVEGSRQKNSIVIP